MLYTGILLDAGEHTIELSYRTPGLIAGMVLSLAGIALTVLLQYFYKRRLRQGK